MATMQRNGTGVSAEFAQKNTNTPVAATDIANKAYVDAVAQGLSPKTSVVAATAAVLAAYTYANGIVGVGATISFTAVGAQTVDGVVPALGERVLVKNETAGNAPYNGIYTVTVKGTGILQEVWTRSLDCDQSDDFPGAFVFCESGTVNTGAGFVCTNTAGVVVGTTAITWTQFSGAGEITAGDGLTKSGNTLNVGAGDGIQSDADSVTVKLDGTTLSKSAAGLKVVSGVGGLSAPDTFLMLPFFSAQSLVPPNTFKEELYTYPTPDFTNLNGGSLSRSMSRQKFTPSGNPANFGWDMLAAKSKILGIMTMARTRAFGQQWFLSSTLPSASEVPNNSYLFGSDTTNAFNIIKVTAGPTYTVIGQEVALDTGDVKNSPNFGIAFYYDDATNRLILFVRIGAEAWFPIIDITDASFTTFRYIGMRMSMTGNWMYTGTPMAIYTD